MGEVDSNVYILNNQEIIKKFGRREAKRRRRGRK